MIKTQLNTCTSFPGFPNAGLRFAAAAVETDTVLEIVRRTPWQWSCSPLSARPALSWLRKSW